VTPTTFVAATIQAAALDARVVVLPLVFGLGLYLVLTALPFGRPKPDLGERLRLLDVDERIGWPIWTVTVSGRCSLAHPRNILRPAVEDAAGLRPGCCDSA
jgi:hypothetical protein